MRQRLSHPQAGFLLIDVMVGGGRTASIVPIAAECGRYGEGAHAGVNQTTMTGSTDGREVAGGVTTAA